MFTSSNGSNSLLLSIQQQLQQLLDIQAYDDSSTTGVNICHRTEMGVTKNNLWQPSWNFTPVGNVQVEHLASDLSGTQVSSVFRGQLIATSETQLIGLTIPVKGRFLYRQYFFNKVNEPHSLRILINGVPLMNQLDISTDNPVGIPFSKEWIIDTEDATTTRIQFQRISGSWCSMNALQLIPISK